jgi:hypothetical protein
MQTKTDVKAGLLGIGIGIVIGIGVVIGGGCGGCGGCDGGHEKKC